MTVEIDGLTEKEKTALRLLLAGYDAKSSARELDVSVHTLNDRLRSARRKLGVTTSKEAARILAQAEDADTQISPKPLVHKGLGVKESEENQESVPAADRSGRGWFPFTGRQKGLMVMSISIAVAAAVLVAVSPSAPSTSSSASDTVSSPARPTASELKARRFVGMIDAGLFDESYAEAGQALRDQYALGKWKFGLTLRMTKGKLQSRDLARLTPASEYAGLGQGRFEIVEFNSLFESDNRQIERVVMKHAGKGWEVVDYEIVATNGK
jgi:DNA-binding CsgD family transcriptional regulator